MHAERVIVDTEQRQESRNVRTPVRELVGSITFTFRTCTVSETREISENFYVDIDADGVLEELVYREVKRESA